MSELGFEPRLDSFYSQCFSEFPLPLESARRRLLRVEFILPSAEPPSSLVRSLLKYPHLPGCLPSPCAHSSPVLRSPPALLWQQVGQS